jgi:hypothetical protein
MKYFKRIFIFVTLSLFVAIFFLRKTQWDNPEYFVRKKTILLNLTKSAQELHRIWFDGEDSREWGKVRNQCLQKYGITDGFDESMLRCHPLLLECVNQFLDKKPFKIVNTTFQYPNYIFTLSDNSDTEKIDVALTDTCHEIYLEQGVYSYGEAPKDHSVEDYQFDNFNRYIYFDQHLVTNSEINEWLKFDKSATTEGIKVETVGNNLFLPATNLSLKQMTNYCSYNGKQLMLAHFFDAATFFSQDRTRSPYYWTKKRNENNQSCDYIFSKDCLNLKKWRININSPSWAGLSDSLGGVTEAFRNPIDFESNLKASSYYFPKNSSWHRLGFRAHWDGEGLSLRNFDFKGIDVNNTYDKFQVGFRCMREVRP